MKSAAKLSARVVSVCALLGAGVIAPTAVATAAGLTISGPGHAQYYAVVTLHGSTAAPDQTAGLYLRRAGKPGFARSRVITSDSTGHYSTLIRIARTTSYYVQRGSHRSATGVTQVATAACRTSGPVIRHLPGLYRPKGGGSRYDYAAALNATRRGTWAGWAHSRQNFSVFTWRPGHHPVVLQRFHYQAVGFEPDYDGTIKITGITPRGTVVAAVEGRTPGHTDYEGLTWTRGVQRRLSAAPNWTEVEPTSITSSGAIIGTATSGGRHGRSFFVRWASASAHFKVIHEAGDDNVEPFADGRGDLAYVNSHGWNVVHLASGGTYELDTFGTSGQVQGATTTAFYGETDLGVARWDLTSTPAHGPIEPTILAGWGHGRAWVTAVGTRGDLVSGFGHRRQHLRTAGGAYVLMPPELEPYQSGEAIDERGTTAYTAPDGLPHLLRCR